MKNWLNFGGNPDHRLDTGIVFQIRHYWEIWKVVNGHKSAAHTDSTDGSTGALVEAPVLLLVICCTDSALWMFCGDGIGDTENPSGIDFSKPSGVGMSPTLSFAKISQWKNAQRQGKEMN